MIHKVDIDVNISLNRWPFLTRQLFELIHWNPHKIDDHLQLKLLKAISRQLKRNKIRWQVLYNFED